MGRGEHTGRRHVVKSIAFDVDQLPRLAAVAARRGLKNARSRLVREAIETLLRLYEVSP